MFGKYENKEVTNKSKKGFTLIEVIVAMFIFVLVIAGSSMVFAKMFSYYVKMKGMQQSIENAQYAMNLMSKTFRTSSVADWNEESIVVFNYSKNECEKYSFVNETLVRQRSAATSLSNCGTSSFGSPEEMTSGMVSGRFIAVESDNDTVGRVTIVLSVLSDTSRVNLQTTTSLRDYQVSGINL